MIRKRTVLILGAGASKEYGYPLQTELKVEILKMLGDEKKLRELSEWHGFSDFLIDSFAVAFGQSGLNNIEEFLQKRPEFMDIGKLLLFECIKEKENLETLFKKEGWYSYLYDAMNDSLDSFGKNNLCILTFNFDLSLEAFLYEALRNTYGKRQEEIVEQLKNIKIVHLHGQVGNLPWQEAPRVREYGGQLPRADIAEFARNMDIVSKREVKDILDSAEVIAFLGFSYNESDMKMLGISTLEGKTILGSTFGLKPGEITGIAKSNNGKISFPKTKIAQALDIEGFLKESGVLGL